MALKDTKPKVWHIGTNISVEPAGYTFWAEGMSEIISRMTIIQFNTIHMPF
jgi:hypothetical protein